MVVIVFYVVLMFVDSLKLYSVMSASEPLFMTHIKINKISSLSI